MTTAPRPAFRIHPFPAAALDGVRATGRDAFGKAAARITADEGGNALRCCLRNSQPGEEMLLFGFEPPLPDSPYREVGAVLVHAEACAGPVGSDVYPADWLGRPQVLRAYDDRGWIHDATAVHDGGAPEEAIRAMLAEPGVARIHSRNVDWGCYMFTVTRAQ